MSHDLSEKELSHIVKSFEKFSERTLSKAIEQMTDRAGGLIAHVAEQTIDGEMTPTKAASFHELARDLDIASQVIVDVLKSRIAPVDKGPGLNDYLRS